MCVEHIYTHFFILAIDYGGRGVKMTPVNNFAYLTDDETGWLATVNCEEVYEKNIDADAVLKEINEYDKTTI